MWLVPREKQEFTADYVCGDVAYVCPQISFFAFFEDQ